MTALAAERRRAAEPRLAAAGSGAYGLRLPDLEDVAELLNPAGGDWRGIDLTVRASGARSDLQWLRPDDALVSLGGGGHVRIERRRGRAIFEVARPLPAAALVHPHLASVAAVLAYWDRRESFHAGAIAVNGGAWILLGDKGAGKSTLLARLAVDGHEILADDLAVLDGRGGVLAGPRLLDLRPEPALRMGVGRSVGVLGLRERWRVGLDRVPAVTPLRGFLTLAWGRELSLTPSAPGERLNRLAHNRMLRRVPPAGPASLLGLCSLPMLELRRPRDWSRMGETAEFLAGTLQGHS